MVFKDAAARRSIASPSISVTFAIVEQQSNEQLPDVEKSPVLFYEEGLKTFENEL